MKILLKEEEKTLYNEILSDFLNQITWEIPERGEDLYDYDIFSEKFLIFNGLTKIVLIPKDRTEKYVLKIPFSGRKDYCKIESDYYKEAEEAGIEYMFAPEEEFNQNIIKYPIYIQLRVETDPFFFKKSSYRSEISKDNYDSMMEMGCCEELIEQMALTYSEEDIEAFCSFVSENYINDIHEENYGYFEGRPVVFDYSGLSN